MMTAKAVFRQVFPEPFRPFRVRMTNGRSYDIEDPSAVYAGYSQLSISTWSLDVPEAKGMWINIPYTELDSIEPINGEPAPVNGAS